MDLQSEELWYTFRIKLPFRETDGAINRVTGQLDAHSTFYDRKDDDEYPKVTSQASYDMTCMPF